MSTTAACSSRSSRSSSLTSREAWATGQPYPLQDARFAQLAPVSISVLLDEAALEQVAEPADGVGHGVVERRLGKLARERGERPGFDLLRERQQGLGVVGD